MNNLTPNKPIEGKRYFLTDFRNREQDGKDTVIVNSWI